MSEEEKERLAVLETRQGDILKRIEDIQEDLHEHIESDHDIQQKILISLAENKLQLKIWGAGLCILIPILGKAIGYLIK